MSREEGRLFALSMIPETSYGVPLTPTSSPKNYEQVVKTGYDVANYTTTPVTNEGMSTGTAYPTKSYPSVHDVDQSTEERAAFETLGRRLLALFGGYAVETVATGIYKHTFAPINPITNLDLPSYTYVEKLGEPVLDADIVHDLMYPGFKAESGSINNPSNADNGAFLLSSISWRGSGKQLGSAVTSGTGSGVNFKKTSVHVVDDATKTENFLKSTSGVFSLYPSSSYGGTVQTLGCDFRGFNLQHNNNLQTNQGYQGCGTFQTAGETNSGAVRGKLPIGKPTTELTFMALVSKGVAQDFNPLNKLRTQGKFSINLAWTGGIITGVTSRSLTFKAPNLTARNVVIGSDEVNDLYTITAETLAPGAGAQPYSFELINDVPSYLTLS